MVDRTMLLQRIDHLWVVNSCSASDRPSFPPLMGDKWLILVNVRGELSMIRLPLTDRAH